MEHVHALLLRVRRRRVPRIGSAAVVAAVRAAGSGADRDLALDLEVHRVLVELGLVVGLGLVVVVAAGVDERGVLRV